MSQNKPEPEGETSEEKQCECPLCALRECFDRARQGNKGLEHFHNAQVEFLRGVRALLDEGIQWMEKKTPDKEARATKIRVE